MRWVNGFYSSNVEMSKVSYTMNRLAGKPHSFYIESSVIISRFGSIACLRTKLFIYSHYLSV